MISLFHKALLQVGDAETAHRYATNVMKAAQGNPVVLGMIEKQYSFQHSSLNSTVAGIQFRNPVGLAAGFDKYGELPPIMHALGFGFTELGTFTEHQQVGNPQPRMFRLREDKALINRMGFNNAGADLAEKALQALGEQSIPIGINIGKSKATPLDEALNDYRYSFEKLNPFADYFVINVSSPNTPGLRELQGKEQLVELCYGVMDTNTNSKPVFVKIAPDLEYTQVDDVIGVVQEVGLTGIVATNTTNSRYGLVPGPYTKEKGGLSGRPLKQRSRDMVKHIWKQTEGKMPIIGVGGIENANDAYLMIKAGASLVQSYTGFIYGGPSFVHDVNKGLVGLLEKDGYKSISEAVGVNAAWGALAEKAAEVSKNSRKL